MEKPGPGVYIYIYQYIYINNQYNINIVPCTKSPWKFVVYFQYTTAL